MLNSHPREYHKAAQDMIDLIREEICMPCVGEGRNLKPVNLSDPLNCQCRCVKVEAILKAATQMLASSKE